MYIKTTNNSIELRNVKFTILESLIDLLIEEMSNLDREINSINLVTTQEF